MKYLKLFEQVNYDLKNLVDHFVNNLSNSFKEELLSDKDTLLDNGVIITNDTIFYFLIGKYVEENKYFATKYDNLDISDKEEIEELLANEICNKFNIEF